VSASDPISIAVVGGGLVAQMVHLPLLGHLADLYRLEALAEPSASLRTALTERHRPVHAFADWETALGSPDLEAVLVASPNPTHGEIVVAALEAGLHVLVEKPMCLTPSQAGRIAWLVTRTGLVVQVGYMKRHDSAYGHLLNCLGQGRHEIRYLDIVTYDPGLELLLPAGAVQRADDLPPELALRLRADCLSQGSEATGLEDPLDAVVFSEVYMGALIHDVNLLSGILDAVGDRLADAADFSQHWAGGRAATLSCRSAGGVPCSLTWLELPEAEDFRETVRVHCADGVFELVFGAPYAPLRHAPTTLTLSNGRHSGAREITATAGEDSFERELVHFHACVRHGVAPLTPPGQALRDQRLLTDAFSNALSDPRRAQVPTR
jgi:predicted dehydrogenase